MSWNGCIKSLEGKISGLKYVHLELAKTKALAILEDVKVAQEMDRDMLISVARTSLRTKVHAEMADLLTEVRWVV